jgi:bis(5'-nucleosyl)-tetraphosphatase (symmetrical)
VRTIVIGDVHGCLEELDQLLTEVEFRKGDDRLILAGDLVDRGPDPVGVVRRARELGAEGVLGNHEEKQLRFRRHEAKKLTDPKYKNPMRPFKPERMAQHLAFNEDDWLYMAKLPLFLHVSRKNIGPWYVTHGGFEAGKPLSAQKEDFVVRARYVDAKGKMMPLGDDYSVPEGGVFWATRWTGPESIVYGHNVDNLGTPRMDSPAPNVMCLGIDTGCCFGGKLTAAIFTELIAHHPEVVLPRLHQVQAKKVYAELGRERSTNQ